VLVAAVLVVVGAALVVEVDTVVPVEGVCDVVCEVVVTGAVVVVVPVEVLGALVVLPLVVGVNVDVVTDAADVVDAEETLQGIALQHDSCTRNE